MTESSTDLASCFARAEDLRENLSSNGSTDQQTRIDELIGIYKKCQDLAHRTAIFSPNETVEDIGTNNLKYLTIDSRISDLYAARHAGSRRGNLKEAQVNYEAFLRRLENYEMLSVADCRLLEQFIENRDDFTVASKSDPSLRREIKIRRFQKQKQLDASLAQLRRQKAITDDDEIVRKLHLAEITKCSHEAFQNLESIAQELHILSLAPSEDEGKTQATERDAREKARGADGYSERLDGMHLSAGLSGPLLDSKGKPMRPFTLLGKRQELRQGVFRPDHSLPTMSIDEYLDEERRRGGMIEGGGAQSGLAAEPDEDNIEKADAETMKARAWDDFTEANPKGSGNTLNRG